jgi:hypothetical protein
VQQPHGPSRVPGARLGAGFGNAADTAILIDKPVKDCTILGLPWEPRKGTTFVWFVYWMGHNSSVIAAAQALSRNAPRTACHTHAGGHLPAGLSIAPSNGPSEKRGNVRITMLAAGSRGDVQPYVALGMALQQAGTALFLG